MARPPVVPLRGVVSVGRLCVFHHDLSLQVQNLTLAVVQEGSQPADVLSRAVLLCSTAATSGSAPLVLRFGNRIAA